MKKWIPETRKQRVSLFENSSCVRIYSLRVYTRFQDCVFLIYKSQLHIARFGFRLTLNFIIMESMMASIMLFAGNFAPRNWAFCEGQLLSVSQFPALFSLLGTIYGGDGRTTFALPDLRGRVPLGPGRGPGLSFHPQGIVGAGGAETHTLNIPEMPVHNHLASATIDSTTTPINLGSKDGVIKAVSDSAEATDPAGAFLAKTGNIGANNLNIYGKGTAVDMAAGSVSVDLGSVNATLDLPDPTVTVGINGSSLAHNNMQPYLPINYIICLQGIFPSRS